MKKTGNLIFALSLSTIILVGCGDGGSDSSNNSGSNSNIDDGGETKTVKTRINTFSAMGNKDSNGVLVVDPAVNDGKFDLSWDVESMSIYRVEMYVSKDDELSKNFDEGFYGTNCGNNTSNGSGITCGKIASIDCRFETNNRISCGDGIYVNNGVNLTDYFTGLPSEDYLIIEACGVDSYCDQKSFKIIFN